MTKNILTIVLISAVTAVLVVVILKFIGFENPIVIAGGVAGGISGAIATSFMKKSQAE